MNSSSEEPPFISDADFTQHDQYVAAANEAILRTGAAIENSYADLREFLGLLPYLQGYPTPDMASPNLIQHLSIIINELNSAVHLCLNVIDALIHELNKELAAWKRGQQLAGNGYAYFSVKHLDIIQSRCDDSVRIAGVTLKYIKDAKNIIAHLSKHYGQEPLPSYIQTLLQLSASFEAALTLLIITTFLIEEQPPQIMKTNTRFSPQLKVRLLTGKMLLEFFKVSELKVTVSIINEIQANQFVTNKKIPSINIGEISGNTAIMDNDLRTNQFSVTFRNMQLKKIKRAEKKGCESVVDEKFALLVMLNCKIDDNIEINTCTMSLPVTVIVHGNQEAHACATVTWDNGTAEPNRKFFNVPDEVPWLQVASILNMKMFSVAGRTLTDENMNYLAEKLFGRKPPNFDYGSMMLSWNKFAKETLPGHSFTFWDWFYSKMKLTKDHLKELWMEGKIVGFIGKNQAEELLHGSCAGTFVLRFSDSELGGVSISCVQIKNGYRKVISVLPFTSKDLVVKSLPNRLHDLQNLAYLYPDIPKDTAFGQYYTQDPRSSSSSGYYGTVLQDSIVDGSANTMSLPPLPSLGENSSSYGGSSASYSGSQSNSPSDTVSVFASNRNSYNSTTSNLTQEELFDFMDVQQNLYDQ